MALASVARGTATSNSSGTNNLTLTPSGNFAKNSLAVLVVAYDNSGTNGADPFGTGSVTDSLGNTWVSRHATLNDPSTASNGTCLRIFTSTIGVAPLTTGTTITFTTQTAVTAKVCALWEITAAAGQKAVYLSQGTGATGASTAPSVTTGTIAIGDLTVGASANEYGTAQTLTTPDADSTNGTWSTNQYTEIGTTTSGQNVTTQTKVQTTANSTQTYNLTMGTSTDWAAGWISVDEVSGVQSLTLGLLDGAPALYAPTVSFPPPLFTARLTTLGYVAHYRMGEASGAVVDRSGTANNGTVNNDNGTIVRDVTGGLGNGQDDGAIGVRGFGRIDVAHNAVLNFGDTFTIGFGYKRSSSGASSGIYAKGTGATDILIYFSSTNQLRLAESAGGASVAYADPGTWSSMLDGNWHFVVITKSGATSKVYWDGQDATSAGTNVTFANNGTAVIIGAYNDGTDRWDGDLDEFFLASSAYTAQNVADLYQSWLNGAGASAQTLTIGLLDGSPALYQPTLLTKSYLTIGLLDGAPALYAPSLTPKNLLTVPYLDAGAALYQPTLTVGPALLTIPLLDGAPALYAPTISTAAQTLTVPLLDAGPTLYAPLLYQDQFVTLGLLDGAPALYALSLQAASVPFFVDRVTTYGYVAHYRLGEASGSVIDRSATANHGTVNNDNGTMVRDVAGGLGNSQDDGALGIRGFGHVDIPHNAVLNFADSFSFAFGVKHSNDSNSRVIYAKGATSTSIAIYFSSTGQLRIAPADTGAAVAYIDPAITTALNDNAWHFVVVTKNGATTKWYFDGADVTQNGTNVTFANNSAAVFLGSWADSTDRFNGDLDEFIIKTGVYSATEVAALYNSWLNGAGSGPQTLSLPTLDGSMAPYAPTLSGGFVEIGRVFRVRHRAVSVPTGARDVGRGVYTIAAGTILPDLLDSNAALYAPMVSMTGLLTVPLLDGTPTLYAPSLLPTNLLTVPLLDASPTTYAPALVAKNTLALGLLDAGPTVYAPSIVQTQSLTLGLLDAAPVTYAPSLLAKYLLTVPLLDSTPTLYAPLIAPTQGLTVPFLDAGAALYQPTLVTTALTLALPLLDSVSALYAMEVQPDQFVTLGLLDAPAALYAPTLLPQATGATLPLLDAGGALYAPTVAAKYLLTVPFLDGAPATYAPALFPTVVLPFLDAGPTTYAPSLSVTVSLPLVDSVPALYPPQVQPDQFLTVPLLDGSAALYDPVVGQGGALFVPLLDGAPAVYAPSLTVGPVGIIVGFLDSAPAVYPPTVQPAPMTLTLALLDGNRAVYAPTLDKLNTISLGLLDGSADPYPPVISPQAIGVGLAFLDAYRDVYPPDLSQGVMRTLFMDEAQGDTLTSSDSMGSLVPSGPVGGTMVQKTPKVGTQ